MTESNTQRAESSPPGVVEDTDLIIVPILESDLSEVERTQRYMVECCRPFLSSSVKGKGVALRYVLNGGNSPEIMAQFDRIVAATGIADQFRSVDLMFADLEPTLDYYQKSQEGMPRTELGYASGPNLMFAFIADSASRGFRNTFLMELDCVPMQEGWAGAILEAVDVFPEAWVLGSRYHGWSWLPEYLRRHLNGNAVYRFSNPEFSQFVDEVWLPRLKESACCGYPGMAYDCLPSILEVFAQGPLVPSEFRRDASLMERRFVEIPSIVNLAGMEDRRDRYPDLETLRETFTEASIIHSKWLSDEVFAAIELSPIQTPPPPKGEMKSAAPPDLNFCIRHLTFSEGSWAFGDAFVLGPEAQLLMNIIVNKQAVGELELRVQSTGPMRITVRRWREKVSNGRGIVASLLGFLLLSEHRRFKKRIKKWSRKTGMTKFLIEVKRFRSRFPLLRGRKLSRVEGTREIAIRISNQKIGKAGGIAIGIDSLENAPVRGTFSVEWIGSDTP